MREWQDDMYKELSKKRRKEISKYLENGELLIVSGGNDELGVLDPPKRENRNHDFFYLTGCDIPESVLMIANVHGTLQEFLFIRRGTENDEFYLGISKDPLYYCEKTGIEDVMYIENLEDTISNLTLQTNIKKVYFASSKEKISNYPRFDNFLIDKLQRAYPGVQIGSLSAEVENMRMRKDTLEIQQIRTAINLTEKSLRAVAQRLKPGMKDYQLQSIIEHEIKMNGGAPDIIEALLGEEACIMHNFLGNKTAEEGMLFLADISVFYNEYCCDISRTFPVSGKFTEEQAYWYSVCLKTQELVIENLTPGKLWSECGREANAYLESELRKHGYLGVNENVRTLIGECRRNYATPGMVNHGIGLHYHESRMDEDGEIVPGMVVAIEPGIYLGEKNMGIRIEDDVLITETGVEVLSANIPKSLFDIEALMR